MGAAVSRRVAARDIVIVVAAIGLAWLFSRYWLYPRLGLPDNAPLLLRPLLGFAVAWLLIRFAGQRWRDLGLRRPGNLASALLGTVVLFTLVYLASTRLVPVLAGLFSATPGPVFLGYIRGNTVAFVGWIAIAWSVGGFAEELLFRGFLIDRASAAFGSGWLAGAGAVSLQAALFGLMHLHQGSLGLVFSATMAVIYGVVYLSCGRNLWPLILVHGAWNSVAIAGLYRS